MLELVENVRNIVNASIRADGTSIVRHAMIESGLSIDLDGYRKVEQLRTELRRMIENYPENFGGLVSNPPNVD